MQLWMKKIANLEIGSCIFLIVLQEYILRVFYWQWIKLNHAIPNVSFFVGVDAEYNSALSNVTVTTTCHHQTSLPLIQFRTARTSSLHQSISKMSLWLLQFRPQIYSSSTNILHNHIQQYPHSSHAQHQYPLPFQSKS
jgi:hypothetical protein